MVASESVLHRYEQVATHVRHLIESGTYSSQEKLPSVRNLSTQLQVSITTVLEAYRMLEDQGLVEARPQSGYYVNDRTPLPPRLAGQTLVEDPVDVGMGEFLMRFLRDFQRRDLVQFGSACPNPAFLPTARLARGMGKVAKEIGLQGNQYDIPPGCETLRVQIARRALQSGCVVAPEEVMLTLGCQEALTLCLLATCKAGDAVVVESPTFYGHLQAIEMLGLKAVEIPSDPVHGLSLAALRQSLEDVPVRAVLLCTNFSNPTGASLSDDDKQELLEILGRHELPLIEDDIFGDLSHAPHRPHAARAFDRHDRVLLCSSFSKTLAPGYRVGWVLAGPRYMPRLHQLKLFSNLGSPILPALAISEFLSNGAFEHHLRQCKRHYARQVCQMAEAVARNFPAGTLVTRPKGGFVIWVELPVGCDTRTLYPKAIELGLTFGPGPIFSARGRFRNCLRLCAPYWDASTEPMLVRLGDLLRARCSR
ncbi:PLP-dependent aminotransferase family protein [bacterium]|nr:PLP-dependent aminotransferase family protein [bacterium]